MAGFLGLSLPQIIDSFKLRSLVYALQENQEPLPASHHAHPRPHSVSSPMDHPWTSDALHLPRLAPAASDLHQQLHLAALEHTLASPITIRGRDDIQSARHWSETLEPFEHQVRNLVTFCRNAPVMLIADEVGLGKTISAGLVLSELMTRRMVHRALVLAPRILLPQWKEELRSKFGIDAVFESGRNVLWMAEGSAPIVMTTYETMRTHAERIKAAGFDMVIMDEAHKLRNLHGSATPPKLATVIRDALGEGAFRFVLMLTATPIQNRLWDLYSLVDCLSAARRHDNPFGSRERFAAEYIGDEASRALVLRPDKRDEFRRRLGDYMVRTTRRLSGLVFPSREVALLPCAGGEVEARMLRLVRGLGLDGLAAISLAEAMMSSPAALAAQLQTMAANGTAPAEAADEARRIAEGSPTGAKMPALLDLVRRLREERGPGYRLVVFTRRRATQAAIGAVLELEGAKVGFIGGGQGTDAQARTLRAFWSEGHAEGASADAPGNGDAPVNVLVSTDAGAEGINLQIANVVVNYDLPWNPMVVEQRIGRVQRLASRHRHVAVMNLVVAGSIEETVVGRLLGRLQVISETIGDVEGILEAAGRGDDPEGQFEAGLRDLVLKALQGQDVAAATAAMEATIERARAMYAQEKDLVEENLGHLDAMHHDGPPLPKFEPVRPRMDLREFVRRAFEAEGAIVEAQGERLRVRRPGQPELLATFDEVDPLLAAGPGGAGAELFAEGRPAFERLVGDWSMRRSHRVRDRSRRPGVDALAAARAWVEAMGVEFVGATEEERRHDFVGEATFRATIGVAHDRIQRLVTVQVGEAGARSRRAAGAAQGAGDASTRDAAGGGEAAPAFDDDLHLPSMAGHDPERIRRTVAAQPDFREFEAFYLRRRDLEARRATSEELRLHVERQFTPQFAAELHAADGQVFEVVRVRARFRAAEGGPYEVALQVADGEVGEAPPKARCAVSGLELPTEVLEACAVSGAPALPHLLVRSASSGRRALPERTARCQVTQRLLLDDEVAACAVTGRVADLALFETCAVTGRKALREAMLRSELSGRWALPEQTHRCEETQAVLLPGESEVCARTGLRVRIDRLARCEVSGALVLERLLTTCQESGRRALPDALEACEVSGYRVDPGLLVVCSQTRKRVLGRLTEVCPACGEPLLRSEAGQDSAGRYGHHEHLGACAWRQQTYFVNELGSCAVTGVSLHKEVMVAEARVSRAHLNLLVRRRAGEKPDKEMLGVARAAFERAGIRVQRVWVQTSERGEVLAVVGEQVGFLGMGRVVGLGFVMRRGGEVVGRVGRSKG